MRIGPRRSVSEKDRYASFVIRSDRTPTHYKCSFRWFPNLSIVFCSTYDCAVFSLHFYCETFLPLQDTETLEYTSIRLRQAESSERWLRGCSSVATTSLK
ncbi:hypothetical protein Y032_0124g1206 [Ancylostoma ceylanicum]|uniref:Uncharacterized protein n=1 Tax=Ancylostoma ceylanicum TaxID=53326 RepID=A0A016T901_9BILA|nr:hypothetical protein Y032_0124g1206 [Ancylostoma ceylanicum]